MAADCDYGFMIWDGSSTGTLSNAIELIEKNKAAVVYVSKSKQFLNIKNVQDIENLIKFMSETSLKKADIKIGLFQYPWLKPPSSDGAFDLDFDFPARLAWCV